MFTLIGTIMVIMVLVVLANHYDGEYVFKNYALLMGLFLILCLCADWLSWGYQCEEANKPREERKCIFEVKKDVTSKETKNIIPIKGDM